MRYPKAWEGSKVYVHSHMRPSGKTYGVTAVVYKPGDVRHGRRIITFMDEAAARKLRDELNHVLANEQGKREDVTKWTESLAN